MIKNSFPLLSQNTCFIETDLNQNDCLTLLKQNGLEESVGIVVLMEGILMYINESQVLRLFSSLRDFIKTDIWFLFEFLSDTFLDNQNKENEHIRNANITSVRYNMIFV